MSTIPSEFKIGEAALGELERSLKGQVVRPTDRIGPPLAESDTAS